MTGTSLSSSNGTRSVKFGGMEFKFKITPDEELEERRKIEERLKKRDDFKKIQKMQLNSLMDEQSKLKRFDNFIITKDNAKFYKVAYNYADRFQEVKKENLGYMFTGGVGTGKSHLSFCIANHLLDQDIPVVAVGHGGLNQKMKEISRFGSEDEIKFFNTLKRAELLIIDDLGTPSKNNWEIAKLYEVINSRYNSNLPIIVTTNLSQSQLRDYLNTDGEERIWDRLVEMCVLVEFDCKPWRTKKAKQKQEVFKKLILGE